MLISDSILPQIYNIRSNFVTSDGLEEQAKSNIQQDQTADVWKRSRNVSLR
jgi:hypothetical protein